jgi:hypothetical protein
VTPTSDAEPESAATRGSTSLVEVLDDFRRSGFEHDFVARAGAVLVCGQCNESFDLNPDLVTKERRVEGASDPDEMQLAIALKKLVQAVGAFNREKKISNKI